MMELKRRTPKEREAFIHGQYLMSEAIKSKINLMDIADKDKVIEMIDEFTVVIKIFHDNLNDK